MPNEAKQNFPELVERSFAFLVREHRFRCTKAEPDWVRYESTKVFIDILYSITGPLADHAVLIMFGRLGRVGEDLAFSDFLFRLNPQFIKSLGEMIVWKPEQLGDLVERLAHALQSHGSDILQGKEEIFEMMQKCHWPFKKKRRFGSLSEALRRLFKRSGTK